jgi:lipopolysaccharide/colanic/teichoic acid biosynthesis glycosyltransferase
VKKCFQGGNYVELVVYRPQVILRRRIYQIVKRFLDLTFILASLPFVLMVVLVCAVAVALDSAGPVLFVQTRVGKGGRHFKIYKFRTMHHNNDTRDHRTFMKAYIRGEVSHQGNEKAVFKPFSERQLTRVGRILRKTSLDELPQLFNVVKGDMSLVGPRPNVPWEVQEYRDWHRERLRVLPGITGLAQISGRSGITFDDIVRYDIDYIENQNLVMDLQILWRTVTSVLTGNGAH